MLVGEQGRCQADQDPGCTQAHNGPAGPKGLPHCISETAAGQNLACAKTISHGAERRFVTGQW